MENTTNKQDEKGHDANIVLAVSGLIEKWKIKHHDILDEYSKGHQNNEVMKMYRTQMKMVLDFIDDLSAACASGAVDKTVSDGLCDFIEGQKCDCKISEHCKGIQ